MVVKPIKSHVYGQAVGDGLGRRVLVLCHGNVMRSPLAEAVLARKLGREWVRSAGLLAGCEGRLVARKVREYAAGLGLDLEGQRSREVTEEDMLWADVVLYMDTKNEKALTNRWHGQFPEAYRLAGYVGKDSVPDPCYLSRGPKLTSVLDLVVECCEAFLT